MGAISIDRSLYLNWHTSLNIGNDLIDEQHQALFTMFNNIVTAIESDFPVEFILDNLNTFRMKAAIHFESEEDLMVRFQYTDTERHSLLHNLLLKKIDEFITTVGYKQGQLDSSSMHYLKSWLLDHTQKEDRTLLAMVSSTEL